ncbi:cytochrome P450 [Bradyrhizobium diazoefficiens]
MNEQAQPAGGDPLFNPLSPDFIRNPYPHYDRLRAIDPIHVTPFGQFVASRHADVSLVMRDKRFGKDFVERSKRRYSEKIMDEPVFRSMSHWMLQADPPDHTRLRGLVVKAFTARRVEDMRPRIQEIVDEAIDAVIDRGHMDLIEDFAFRLPVTIICDMLGIPEDHREVFYKSSRDGGRLLDPVPLTPEEIAKGNAGNMMAQMYFQQLFELRRRNPADDLTTQLVQAEEDGNKLTNEELTANIILLFGAGHETTVNLIGNGLLALHRNPDQLALLKARPELMVNAIEEFLALRFLGADDRARHARGYRRSRRQENPQGRDRAVPARLGQPRSGGLSRSPRPARRHPSQRQAAVVRRRHPFLPGGPIGADRGRDRHRHAVAPAAGSAHRRRREPGMAADLRAARPEELAGELVRRRALTSARNSRCDFATLPPI